MARATLLAWAAACGALLACGSGSGPLVTTSTQGRDNPGSTRDTPPNARDAPTTASGGGGTSDCIECDVDYTCTGSPGFQDVSLSSSQGTCTAGLIDSICSGAVFGTPPCSGGGGGPFTCGGVTCTPSQSEPPQPGGGGTGGTGASSGSGSSSGS